MEQIILKTDFQDIPLVKRGKVRDIYDLGEHLLLVATDRISAFDVILPNGIPGKGRVLTKISVYWFRQMEDIISHHIEAVDIKDFPANLKKYAGILDGRSLLVKKTSLKVYTKASTLAEKKGIIIADTKFEFGLYNGELIIIDEILTPDSSRFWSLNHYAPGKSQDSYDKQIVRDYLLTLDWDKTYPGPPLPGEIIEKTVKRYGEILKIITGEE